MTKGIKTKLFSMSENLRPTISFVAEGSAIKAFRQEPVRVVSATSLHSHTEVSH